MYGKSSFPPRPKRPYPLPPAPLDITSMLTDYLLQQGETVFKTYIASTAVPLRVAITDKTQYELTITGPYFASAATTYTYLYPNGAAPSCTSDWWTGGAAGNQYGQGTTGGLMLCYASPITLRTLVSNYPGGKSVTSQGVSCASGANYHQSNNCISDWQDSATPWTSLGTIVFPQAQTGTIVIRRIL